MNAPRRFSSLPRTAQRVAVFLGAGVLTLLVFLLLPLIQAMTEQPVADRTVRQADSTTLPPPPPPPEPQKPQEPDEPETPPELTPDAPPLDLAQLEMALNPGLGGGYAIDDFSVGLDKLTAGGEDVDGLFSAADLDQQPRVVFQPGPVMDKKLENAAPGQVTILFVVSADGRVESPIIQHSSDPIFERPALTAVRQWRFEPGRRKGEPVKFRMRVPMTFPKGR